LELDRLLKWCAKSAGEIHPLILALDFHRRYEWIHPFLDGNGRTGRLIMNRILIHGGYFPIVVFKENKLSYFNSLNKARQGGEKKYYRFMLSQAEKTYDLILDRIQKY
jgi:Fic family protein